MPFKLHYPKPRSPRIVLTQQMQRFMDDTMNAHGDGGLVVWTGKSRLGKTTTAQLLHMQLTRQFRPTAPDAFLSTYCAATGDLKELPRNRGIKRGIRVLHEALVGTLDSYAYRCQSNERLIASIINEARRRQVQMMLVDEAGTLTSDELRGFVAVYDHARREHWPFTIVLIGMDNLVGRIKAQEQIDGRVQQWCLFKEYKADDVGRFLREISPYFSGRSPRSDTFTKQVAVVARRCKGRPGFLVPFVRRLEELRVRHPSEKVTEALLETLAILLDKERGAGDA